MDQAFKTLQQILQRVSQKKRYLKGTPFKLHVKIVGRNGIIKKVELNEQCQNKCL